MKMYGHGGNIYEFASKNGFKADEVIDFSSNINFLKPDIGQDIKNINISSYPDTTYSELKQSIASRYSVDSLEQIELFNGASSAIFSLFRFLNLPECTIYSPAYLEYKKSAAIFGYETDMVNRFENMDAEVKEDSLVVFVNPSTPDGKLYEIKKLMQIWKEKNCIILIDESFLDFTDGDSAISFLKEYDKLYILKSMTKFYSCAGVRVGILISNSNNILKIKEKEPAWKISAFDSEYIKEALKDEAFEKKTTTATKANRDELLSFLKASGLFDKVYESSANFILARLKNMSAKTMQKELIPFKIMIRDCENFDFLDESYVRFAVKDMDSIERLKIALKNIKK